MDKPLVGHRVAILVVDNFEQAELTGPKLGLESAGATTVIASAKRGQVRGMHHDEKADRFEVEETFDALRAEDFDAVVLPGGVFNADRMRGELGAQKFVKSMAEQDKPIAVICHGAWLLASLGLVKGKTMTSWPSLADDLTNAGATWVDKEVVVDGKLVSSRKPDDIPAFNQKIIEVMSASHAVSHS